MLERYFPEKQIYVRNSGQVSYFILKSRTQLMLSVGMLLLIFWFILTLLNIILGKPLINVSGSEEPLNNRSLVQCRANLKSYQQLSEWSLEENQILLIEELGRVKKENRDLLEASLCNDLSSMIDKSNELKIEMISENNKKLRTRISQLVDDRDKLFQLLANEQSEQNEKTVDIKKYNFGQRVLSNAVDKLGAFLNGSKVEVTYTKKELTDKVLQVAYFIIASFLTVPAWFLGLVLSRKNWIKQSELPQDIITKSDPPI